MTNIDFPKPDEHEFNDQVVFMALCNCLREANWLFLQDNIHGGRAGVIHGIRTILDFLRPINIIDENGDPLIPLAPFSSLLQALEALDKGNILPLLAKAEGGAKSSGMYESLKGYVAFVVRRLKKSGMPINEAYTKVVAILKKHGVRPARNGNEESERVISVRTVRKWCSDVRRGEDTAALTCRELETKFPSELHDKGKHIDTLRQHYLAFLEKFITTHRCHEVK